VERRSSERRRERFLTVLDWFEEPLRSTTVVS